jgi:hypothetical protein
MSCYATIQKLTNSRVTSRAPDRGRIGFAAGVLAAPKDPSGKADRDRCGILNDAARALAYALITYDDGSAY